MRGATVVIVTAGLIVGVVAGWSRAPVSQPAPTPPAVTTPTSFDVHVAGQVVSPGVVTVAEGSIVADAVAAAGGLLAGANTDAINLAAPVIDGQQIVVPGTEGTTAGPTGDGPVRLNSANAGELEELDGVGPVLAERIVAYREANGPFTVAEDLLLVPGIGEAKLAAIRDQVVVP